MKLAAGMRLVERSTKARYQVVLFDTVTASLRRLRYAELERGMGMRWVVDNVNEPPRKVNRRHLDILFCTEAEVAR